MLNIGKSQKALTIALQKEQAVALLLSKTQHQTAYSDTSAAGSVSYDSIEAATGN